MGKGRLDAFSDGVLAIIITIMVLQMKVPHGNTPEALKPLVPVFFKLRTKLCKYCYLLEQSSPHDAYCT